MAEQKQDGPHPRREPRFPGPLTLEGVEQIFEGCSDFAERTALLHNDPQRQVTLCYINGMVRGSGSTTICCGRWPRTRACLRYLRRRHSSCWDRGRSIIYM